MSGFREWVLRKENDENNRVVFMCCREGIEDEKMEEIEKKLEDIEKEQGYADKLGIEYSNLCNKYWRNFLKNSKGKLFDLLKEKYSNVEKSKRAILNELRINNSIKQYTLRWDYEIVSYASILIRVHLFDKKSSDDTDCFE